MDLKKRSFFGVVTFHRHENKWDSVVRTAEIFPYFKSDVEGLLKGVGFKKMDFYRNFNFEDYDKNGPDLIVVCEKKGTLKGKLPARSAASSEKTRGGAKAVSPKARGVLHLKPSSKVSPQSHRPALSKEKGTAATRGKKPRTTKTR
jgi:hypothetical protein